MIRHIFSNKQMN